MNLSATDLVLTAVSCW